MTRTTTALRLEFKYPVPLAWELGLPLGLGLRRVYPDRDIASLYFDTPRWRLYFESEEGLSKRAKLRIRTYNQTQVSPLRLEIKRRDGRLGSKELIPLPHGTLRSAIPSVRALLPSLDLPPHLVPALIVQYRRSYFSVTRNGVAIRVTWDRDIAFTRFSPTAHNRQPEVHLSTAVIEVKGAIEHACETELVGRQLRRRRARFSKYALAVQHVCGRR